MALTKYEFRDNLLDVGCGEKPYRYLFDHINKYLGIDFKSYSYNKDFIGLKPDYYFNNTYKNDFNLPFDNNAFQNVVAFQVLEQHKNPQK